MLIRKYTNLAVLLSCLTYGSMASAENCNRWINCSADETASATDFGRYVYGNTSDIEPWLGSDGQRSKFKFTGPEPIAASERLAENQADRAMGSDSNMQNRNRMSQEEIDAARAYLDGLEEGLR